jgi:hypothetical protein
MKSRGKGKLAAAESSVEIILAAVLKVLEKQINVLERAAAVFQRAQRMLPLPPAEELAEMRARRRPVNRRTYLLWFLQRAVVALEEIATGLRNEIEDGTEEVQIEGFSETDFNYIAEAVKYVRREGALRPRRSHEAGQRRSSR